ncbi:MAG: nitronate monooxygenase [Helicobacter sp.]|nr:nitronate monooxygenase [Helicobacter sp.]
MQRKTTLPPLTIRGYTIPYPIVQGGMGVGISWDELAGTVSREGGLGVISAVGTGYYQNFAFVQKLAKNRPFEPQNFYSKAALIEIFKNARVRCGSAPLGANVLYAINDYGRVVYDACEAGANIIITGAGLPTDMPEFTSDFPDVALVPIVSSARALRILCKRWNGRYKRIPDAVVVEGPLSGGHQGVMYEDCFKPEYQLESVFPEVVKEAKDWGNIPLLAAGGIWDRSDIDRFMDMGASGVQMATRFLGTHECDAKYYAKLMPTINKDDIVLVKSPVGYPARAIMRGVLQRMQEGTAPKIACVSHCVQPCQRGVQAKIVGYCIADRLGDGALGDAMNGLYFTGANGYRIDKIVSVREIMNELICD